MGKYFVECELCGLSYEQITGKHLQSAHDIGTVAEYQYMFPNASIYSEVVLKAMSSWQENATERNDNISRALTGREITWGKEISEAKSGVPANRTFEESSDAATKAWKVPGRKELQSEIQKTLWADPDFKNKQVTAMRSGSGNLHPNYPESWVRDLLEFVSPGRWKFNEGELVVAGKVPDYYRTDGVRDCIELLGDYWHGTEEEPEVGRQVLYERAGWRCLILWEHELPTRNPKEFNSTEFLAKLEAFGLN